MADSFNAIEREFTELRGFFLNDLRILLQSPVGGNYAVVLVVMTACEVFGPLRFENNGEREFFRKYLVPALWQPVADSLYEALRNGLAHSYAPKAILQVNGTPLELGISWQEKPHLMYDTAASTIYINVHELAQALITSFETYENELRRDRALCDLFGRRRHKKRTFDIPPNEKQAWKRLLSSQSIGS